MKSTLQDRILSELADMFEAGKTPVAICLGKEQLAALGEEMGIPLHGINLHEFLGMELKIVPDFALIDANGEMHTR